MTDDFLFCRGSVSTNTRRKTSAAMLMGYLSEYKLKKMKF